MATTATVFERLAVQWEDLGVIRFAHDQNELEKCHCWRGKTAVRHHCGLSGGKGEREEGGMSRLGGCMVYLTDQVKVRLNPGWVKGKWQ